MWYFAGRSVSLTYTGEDIANNFGGDNKTGSVTASTVGDGVTLKNTPQTTSIKVTKSWLKKDGETEQEFSESKSIEFTLYQVYTVDTEKNGIWKSITLIRIPEKAKTSVEYKWFRHTLGVHDGWYRRLRCYRGAAPMQARRGKACQQKRGCRGW